ncbi:hypothetical protein AAC387_Pa07g3616 [Persea americana]
MEFHFGYGPLPQGPQSKTVVPQTTGPLSPRDIIPSSRVFEVGSAILGAVRDTCLKSFHCLFLRTSFSCRLQSRS